MLIVLSGFLGIGRLFRGWPVFLRAEVRPFCRPFVVQRQGWQQAQSETLVRGLTLRRLIITRGNLSTNTKKILSACHWRGWGRCSEVQRASMRALSECGHAFGLLSPALFTAIRRRAFNKAWSVPEQADTSTECCSPLTNCKNG